MDLNFKVNYFVSKQFSAFVQLNNVLSSNYQLYLNYPVRGFQAMVGASWSF
jgi:outer membrane cobalamin receptor